MQVTIASIRALMVEACQAATVPEDAISVVVEHYLSGELRGKSSHGVAKFCYESQFFGARQGDPQIVRERGALVAVDAHREIGPVSAAFAVEVAVAKARDIGAGIVGMINTQRYGVLAQWTEQIARSGLVGVAMNTSRAEATVYGGRNPVLGVNPLSFAFPTLDEPFVADMSTTLAPMGVLWEARRGSHRLPAGCFVDDKGVATNDPESAASAVVFGKHRGFVISLLVQVLTGSLWGHPMGHEVDSTWNTGYTFVALDPSFGGQTEDGSARNTRLIQSLECAEARDGGPLRLPGQNSRRRLTEALRSGALDLPEEVFDRLRARAAGDFESD